MKFINIYINAKKGAIESIKDTYPFKTIENSTKDNDFYAPFEEIITLIATVVISGGLNAFFDLLTDFVKKRIKSISVKVTIFDDIEIECSGATPKEIKELIDFLSNYKKE